MDVQQLITQGETLTIEFKSDRGPLDDAELLNTVGRGRAAYYRLVADTPQDTG